MNEFSQLVRLGDITNTQSLIKTVNIWPKLASKLLIGTRLSELLTRGPSDRWSSASTTRTRTKGPLPLNSAKTKNLTLTTLTWR